jgi:antitoxin YefM
MEAISYTHARENLKSVIDRVNEDQVAIAIVPRRGEGAVLVSAAEWASIQETLYLLSSRTNAKRLLHSIAELEAGRGIELEQIKP